MLVQRITLIHHEALSQNLLTKALALETPRLVDTPLVYAAHLGKNPDDQQHLAAFHL